MVFFRMLMMRNKPLAVLKKKALNQADLTIVFASDQETSRQTIEKIIMNLRRNILSSPREILPQSGRD